MSEPVRILFVSPEAVPFVKTGGLADVSGALPAALRRLGADVRLVLPLYRMVRQAGIPMAALDLALRVPLGDSFLEARVFESVAAGGLPVYLVAREDLFDRPHLYGDGREDYYDNLERFSFFAHAVLRLAEALDFQPHVVHGHDWQAGLIPALLKYPYRTSLQLGTAASVFTVHNVGYQGLFPASKLALTGLTQAEVFHLEGLEYFGNISLLKSGIAYADAVTTVSPRYSREIRTAEYGAGMDGILRRRRSALSGILNGVDYTVWNPDGDPHLAAAYGPKDLSGKGRCKQDLLQRTGLKADLLERPLVGMVTRLDKQKGLDLVLAVLERALDLDLGFVVLGSGDRAIEDALRAAAERHPGRIALSLGFDDALAHRIMAGADIFLIPSRYEPCGLTQMYALRYGTVPVVRATGGLDDTVSAFDPGTGEGNGFKFSPYTPEALFAALAQAVTLFGDPAAWRRVVDNGMAADFGWARSAEQYLALYRALRAGG